MLVLKALLDAQRRRSPIKLYLADDHLPCSSAVLGFDFTQQSLLLDRPVGGLTRAQAHCMTTSPFWLQMSYQNRTIAVQCQTLDDADELFTVRMTNIALDTSRRWFPRVHFIARQGPKFALTLSGTQTLTGNVRDLSVHGARVDFYGNNIRTLINARKTLECRLNFNDFFTLHMFADVQQSEYVRRSPRHSRMRVIFQQTEESFTQLRDFVDMFDRDLGFAC